MAISVTCPRVIVVEIHDRGKPRIPDIRQHQQRLSRDEAIDELTGTQRYRQRANRQRGENPPPLTAVNSQVREMDGQ
jgi:hypothetical protein